MPPFVVQAAGKNYGITDAARTISKGILVD